MIANEGLMVNAHDDRYVFWRVSQAGTVFGVVATQEATGVAFLVMLSGRGICSSNLERHESKVWKNRGLEDYLKIF